MNEQKLRLNICQNENLLTDKKGKISKSKGYFRGTSQKQWTAVTGNEGLTLLSVEILFCGHFNKPRLTAHSHDTLLDITVVF